MFVKKFFKSWETPEVDKSFYRLFRGHANTFSLNKGVKEPLVQNAKITLADLKEDQFKYKIIIGGSTPDDVYAFPLNEKEVPAFCIDADNKVIVFEFKLPDDFTLVIEFSVAKGNYDEAGRFREIITRLMYQARNRQAWQNCKSENELQSLIQDKTENKPKETFSKITAVFDKVMAEHSPVFCTIGTFGKIDPSANFNKPPEVVLPEAIFAFVPKKGFRYDITVFDHNAKPVYQKEFTESMNTFCDENNNNIVWMDVSQSNIACYGFYFQKKVISDLRLVMSTILIESRQKMPIDEVIAKEKNDYDQFYLQKTDHFMEEEDIVEVLKYQDNDYDLDISGVYITPKKLPPASNEIKTFAQGKISHRAFASQGKGLSVYRVQNGQNDLDYLADIPIVQSYKNEHLTPRKMHLQEGDSKMVFLDESNLNKMYYYDIEKNKVVSEFERDAGKGLKDISLMSKDAATSGNPVFLSIGERDIFKVDPRIKDGNASAKNYKTNPKFESIIGVQDDQFAIGSQTGEVRFYGNIGGNAKNLIPSYSGSGVVSLDSSKDGNFLLVNCGTDLLLFPTFQGHLSAYTKIFRKDSKPTPKILKVHPSVLSKFGITETYFKSAKFDEKKNTKEHFIIATSEHFIAIWSLSRVLQGYLDTKNVKKINDTLVSGEFLYDQDGIIAALKDKLVLQPNTKI